MSTEQNINIKQAIYLDCLRLIDNFTRRNNPEFEIFCLEWKLMNFHYIYSCQLNQNDMVQTIMEIFQLCKRLLIKETTKLKKIGLIYLLYALYYKQPTALYVKIQVNLSTWRYIKEFIESLANDDDCTQVRYIFWKLVSENAFRFVESDIYYGLEPFFNREQDYTHNRTMLTELEENIFNNEFINLSDKNEGIIKGFELLENSYNNMKNSINENNKNQISYVPIEPTNFIEKIKNDILSINEIFNSKDNIKENDSKIMKNIKERRSEIRKKAYSKNNQKPGTSKKTLQNDEIQYFLAEIVDNNSEIEEDLPDPINIKTARKISKLNQIKVLLQDPLPEEFQKELGDKND